MDSTKVNTMKLKLVAASVAAALTGCSMLDNFNRTSANPTPGTTVAPGPQQAISEQRLSSDFRREGVRITYTLTGQLDSIEATGYAPVWGNSENARREAFRMAELEAKKAMNDFINQETITSAKSVEIISKNLEKAQDNKTNNFTSNRLPNMISSSDEELDRDPAAASGENNRTENVAVRNDALRIATNTRTEIRINNRGILAGLRLKEGEVINNGRTVRVVYAWDRKSNDQRGVIRNLMQQ